MAQDDIQGVVGASGGPGGRQGAPGGAWGVPFLTVKSTYYVNNHLLAPVMGGPGYPRRQKE